MSIDDDRTRLSGGADAPTMLSPFSGSGSVPSEQPGLTDGQSFGPYRIVRLLGRGGMALDPRGCHAGIDSQTLPAPIIA